MNFEWIATLSDLLEVEHIDYTNDLFRSQYHQLTVLLRQLCGGLMDDEVFCASCLLCQRYHTKTTGTCTTLRPYLRYLRYADCLLSLLTIMMKDHKVYRVLRFTGTLIVLVMAERMPTKPSILPRLASSKDSERNYIGGTPMRLTSNEGEANCEDVRVGNCEDDCSCLLTVPSVASEYETKNRACLQEEALRTGQSGFSSP